MSGRIVIAEGDITKQDVDAIANAANQHLKKGGGVDGAIHRAAGPELQKACAAIGGCPTGEARITEGYRLPARYVIHCVGPRYRDGRHGEPDQLAGCYRQAMALAAEHGLKTIAFPGISTGIYGYPLEAATEIGLRTVLAALDEPDNTVTEVRFVTFNAEATETAQRLLAQLTSAR